MRMYVLFGSFTIMIAAGKLATQSGLLDTQSIEGLRKFAFNLALPALLGVSMWKASLSAELLESVPIILWIHVVWAALAHLVHGPWLPAAKRAWLVLTAQGVFLGYVYPFAAAVRNPELAERMVSAALFFDLGGNMWMCLIWQRFSVGRLLQGAQQVNEGNRSEERPMAGEVELGEERIEPDAVTTGKGYKEREDGEQKEEGQGDNLLGGPRKGVFDDLDGCFTPMKRSSSFSGDSRIDYVVRRHLKDHRIQLDDLNAQVAEWFFEGVLSPTAAAMLLDTKSEKSLGASPEEPPEKGFGRRVESAARESSRRLSGRAFCMAMQFIAGMVKQPIPGAALTGLALNLAGVPVHPWADNILETYGAVFTPAVFAVMGGFLKIEAKQLNKEMLWAIASRCLVQGIMSALLLLLPIDPVTRFSWSLSIWSPMTSFVIVLTFEFHFDEARSVSASVSSQVVSFLAMLLLAVVAAPDGLFS